MGNNPNLATVTALVPPNRVRIRIDGEAQSLRAGVRYLASYAPAIGDRVYFVRESGTYIVIGALK